MDKSPDRPVRGILLMLLTGLIFVSMTAVVKSVGTAIPAAQSAFLRFAIGTLFFLPFLGQIAHASYSRVSVFLFVSRGLVHSIAVIMWFFAMARIPMAEITAINFLVPIYVTLGAVIFLGERLALRRILAVIVALMGALIVLRPGFQQINVAQWAMLASSLSMAVGYLIAKKLTDQFAPVVIVGVLSLIVTICLSPFALSVWVPVTFSQIAALTLVAALATAGHFTMTVAFRAAPLSVIQPVTFVQLIWAALVGLLIFSEPIDIWVIIGGLVIAGAVTYITWREAVLKRGPITPNPAETKF